MILVNPEIESPSLLYSNNLMTPVIVLPPIPVVNFAS